MPPLRDVLSAELDALRAHSLYRRVREFQAFTGPRATLDGRSYVVLGSNNYLGLAGDPRVAEAAANGIRQWGAGASGSRLTTGCFALHRELEQELAAFKGTEDALLFGSGYQAAVGTIPALVGRGDLIVSDALNHACLIDGSRLSRAEIRVFRHADVAHARELLHDRDRFRRCLLLTDGVFSMDGDVAPLPELAALCREFDAWLMVDDAHGTGVLGETGRGSAEHFQLPATAVSIQMGTLSKAFGTEGGFIAGDGVLIDYLRNRARSFIFSTATAPGTIAAALSAVRLARQEPERRERLRTQADRFRSGLRRQGISVPDGPTPIIPVVIGASETALQVAALLERAGVLAPAIRPPTVPPGTARIRASVIATHSDADLDLALEAFTLAIHALSS